MEELHYNLPEQEKAFGAFYPQSETAIQTFLWTDVKPPDKIKLLNACFFGETSKTRREGNVFPPVLSMQQKCFGKKIC